MSVEQCSLLPIEISCSSQVLFQNSCSNPFSKFLFQGSFQNPCLGSFLKFLFQGLFQNSCWRALFKILVLGPFSKLLDAIPISKSYFFQYFVQETSEATTRAIFFHAGKNIKSILNPKITPLIPFNSHLKGFITDKHWGVVHPLNNRSLYNQQKLC